MAEENLDQWQTSPTIVNETVMIAKEYLDKELAKHKSRKSLQNHADKSIRVIFSSNSQFQQCKRDGVGRSTILRFLGGNWKGWMIEEAIKTFRDNKEGTVDREVNGFPRNKD